jgi:hypothetical protein
MILGHITKDNPASFAEITRGLTLPEEKSGNRGDSGCGCPFPDQVGAELPAANEHEGGAQGQAITVELEQPLLPRPDPVGEQADLDVVDDPIILDFIPATVGHIAFNSGHLLLGRASSDVPGREPGAAPLHEGNGHVPIVAIEEVPHTLAAPVHLPIFLPRLNGDKLPCPKEILRIRTCHLNHWVKSGMAEEKSWVLVESM